MKKLRLELYCDEGGSPTWTTVRLKGVDKDSSWVEINQAILKSEGASDEEVEENADGWRIAAESVAGVVRVCEFRNARHYLCIGFINTAKQEF